jgi:hypothetical protein
MGKIIHNENNNAHQRITCGEDNPVKIQTGRLKSAPNGIVNSPRIGSIINMNAATNVGARYPLMNARLREV